MAVLNAWQKLTRVLPGQPFGNGSDGDLTVAASAAQLLTVQSCSGTATQSTLTIASASFTNGDVILIHQSRGTGVGQWEVNRVSSGGGSTTLTLQSALQYTYTDSGASQAQVMKIPMYNNVTVNSGQTWSASGWDGDTYGIFALAAKSLTITGSISATGKGFRGGGPGANSGAGNQGGVQAESELNTSTTRATAANGGGGGGGGAASPAGGGGGGAYGANATTGGAGSGTGGAGGTAYGDVDLVASYFGSGGGGGGAGTVPSQGGNGYAGGGLIILFVKNIVITGSINCNGVTGENALSGGGYQATSGGGGGSAGGGLIIICQTATLGTNLLTVAGGSGGSGNGGGDGGAGAVGRIAVHHSGTITGSSTPAFTDVTDPSLVESMGGSFLFNFI